MEAKRGLGRRIKALRKQAGLTQEGLAERVGLNPKYISGIERGRENPTLDTLLRLARELGAPPVELFDFDLVGIDGRRDEKGRHRTPGTVGCEDPPPGPPARARGLLVRASPRCVVMNPRSGRDRAAEDCRSLAGSTLPRRQTPARR